MLDEVRRFLEIIALATRDGYLSRLRLLRRYDVRGRLHELRCPTLSLASSEDHLVPAVAQARFMESRVPGAAVRILEGHGHICLIAPDVDLNRIIRE
jgi:pimeloyl-ACP methyl ester carboxylesterase